MPAVNTRVIMPTSRCANASSEHQVVSLCDELAHMGATKYQQSTRVPMASTVNTRCQLI
jgi:hypothetical protein